MFTIWISSRFNVFPFQVQPKNFPNDVTVNARDVLHMLSDFKLINDRLSSKVVLQVLAADDPRVYDGDNCNVELEVFLPIHHVKSF